MNQGWCYYNRVDRLSAGLTLLAFYTQRYAHSSEAEWRLRIALGQISVDGQTATEQMCLQKGQNLTYQRPPWEEPNAPLSFDVLYKDSDLLIIAKPSGLPVLPGGGFLEHTLLHQLRRRYPNETPVPIHRLGRGTSGLMLLARSPLAKSGLSQQLRLNTLNPYADRQIRKVYLALAQGQNIPDTFTVKTAIGKIFHPNLGYIYGATLDGKPALSRCRVLKRKTDGTLIEVTISTGRPHQIRIHLAAAGFPLVGDPLYGIGGIPLAAAANPGETIPVPGDCGYYLHAHRLIFTHPRTDQLMDWVCPPPAALSL
jgi:23S rRNA pseudouridine1911/1915/1917 synthase